MALIGGNRAKTFDLSGLGNLLLGSNEVTRRNALAEQERQRALALQQQRQALVVGDRLRSQLSPMDGPNGSGAGALPSYEQQAAALDEARLLNPAVAEQFAPVVQSRRMEQLTQGLPLEQRLAIQLNPEEAGKSFSSQFADEVLAEGSIRDRGGRTIAAAPVTERFDDRFGSYDPRTGQTTYSQPRSPTFAEQTGRVTAERPQLQNISPGQQVVGVSPYGETATLAQSTTPRPVSDSDKTAITKSELAISGINNATGRATNILSQIEGGQLNLNPISNAISRGRNFTGQSDQNSLNYDALMNWAREARDAILAANTGVQTDGDAVRALERILSSPNDENVVRQSLSRFVEAQQGTRSVLERDIARRSGGSQQPTTNGPIAVNPSTGARVQWNGQAWVPIS